MRPSFFALAVLLLTTAGCNGRARNEAKLFLDRYGAISKESPIAQRRAQVQELRRLALSVDEVIAARNVCANMQEALITAEDTTARAQALYRQHAPQRDTDDPMSGEMANSIQHLIDQSDAAVERARDLLSQCDDQRRRLSLKYDSGRRP
ncbi:MAG: hypothetical protein IPK60_08970 [Sandaracinaceae bacterium]|jgi:tRNA isopentenyl-2-thiomethyl-A-37 hydroxylase MiaE|nr:hypothetical protein [Sandaracinaceae bacterium]